MSRLYNKEIKEKYLESLPPNSSLPVRNALYTSGYIEETIDKDLYNFTSEEIKEVLSHANSKSVKGVRSILSYMGAYIKWAIGEGYRNNALSPVINVASDAESLMEFIDKSRKVFYSKEEIDEMIEKSLNYQEKAILQLAFYEGVTMEELIELSYDTVDWKIGILNCKERDLQISEKSLRMVEAAYHEDKMILPSKRRKELIRSKYIIRNVSTPRTKHVQNVSKSIVFSRVTTIRQKFNLEHFTYKSLIKSGMIYEAYKMFQKRGVMGHQELNDIGDRFGIKRYANNGYRTHNVTAIGDHVNRQNILELYSVDISE